MKRRAAETITRSGKSADSRSLLWCHARLIDGGMVEVIPAPPSRCTPCRNARRSRRAEPSPQSRGAEPCAHEPVLFCTRFSCRRSSTSPQVRILVTSCRHLLCRLEDVDNAACSFFCNHFACSSPDFPVAFEASPTLCRRTMILLESWLYGFSKRCVKAIAKADCLNMQKSA